MDPTSLSARDWLDLAYARMADLTDGLVDRHAVLEAMDESLAQEIIRPAVPWGADPQAQAGQRAMMAATGGPAPMRSPDAQRPAAWAAREEAESL